jgi:hypothetical protein
MQIKFIMFILLQSFAMTSFACALHDDPSFGRFGQFHPLAKQHRLLSELSELNLSHANEVSIKSNSDTQLRMNYYIPSHYSDAQVTLQPSEHIIILNELSRKLSLTGGSFNVLYRATEPGEHFILVKLNAMQSTMPDAKMQRINIVSE